MVAQVLVRNPEIDLKEMPQGLWPTTWDEFSFWMEPNFSLARALSLTSQQELSPFLLLEARMAFLVSVLDLKTDTYLAGMSELSSLLFFLRTHKPLFSTSDFSRVLAEYTQRQFIPSPEKSFPQMVIWEDDLSRHLSHLALHARLYLASSKQLPDVPSGFCQEMKWSYGEGSEIGPFYLWQLSR